MLSLEFWCSYFSKHLRLIAVIKSSQRRFSIKKAVLKIFPILTGKNLCWSPQACNFVKKRLQNMFFFVNVAKFLRTPILKNICNLQLLCTSPVSSTFIFQIHTELFLHVQLSLLRDIFCVIPVDNNTLRGALLHKIQFNLHVPRILEIGLNNVKIWKRNWRVSIHAVFQQFALTFVQNENFRF